MDVKSSSVVVPDNEVVVDPVEDVVGVRTLVLVGSDDLGDIALCLLYTSRCV